MPKKKERETYSEFQPVIVPVSYGKIFDKRGYTLDFKNNTKCDSREHITSIFTESYFIENFTEEK